jgi:hypothetical protein
MLVWAYKKITELNGRTGFVDIDKTLAERLVADGHAQNPAVGANALRRIDTNTPLATAYEVRQEAAEATEDAYETKEMTPRKTLKRRSSKGEN